MKLLKIEIVNDSKNHFNLSNLIEENQPISLFSPKYLVDFDDWVGGDFESRLTFSHLNDVEAEDLINILNERDINFNATYLVSNPKSIFTSKGVV